MFSSSTTRWDGADWKVERHEPRWRLETRIAATDLADVLRAIEASGILGEEREIIARQVQDTRREQWIVRAGGRSGQIVIAGVPVSDVPTLAPVAAAVEQAVQRALDVEAE